METETIERVAVAANEAPVVKPRNMKNMLVTAVKIVISGVLIYYILRQTNLAEIWTAMKSANPWLLGAAFLLHGVGYVSSAYRWRLLLAAQKYDMPIPFLVESLAAAVFFNNLLPSTIGGDAMRAYDTARRGVDKMKSIAIVVVDRFLGLFALMIFAVVALSLATELTGKIQNLWLWSLLTFGGMAVAAWLLFVVKVDLNWLWNKPPFSIVKKPIKKMTTAFADFQGKKKTLFGAMVLSLLLQFAVVLHFYLVSLALGLPIPFVKFLVIVPISTFVMMIPISINAIGLRENVSVFFLTIYGATISAGVAFAWITYGMVVLLGVLGGIIYALRK